MAEEVASGYLTEVMKKLTSLALAMVSTMLLVTGATRAAEKFDVLAQPANPAASDTGTPSPAGPCVIIEE